MDKLLEIKKLTINYETVDGIVHAANNVSFSLNYGETLGLVGETGAGKTTTVKSILKILPVPPAKYVSGEIFLNGKDILKKKKKEMREIRGKKISMIFQDPMTSLNPVMKVQDQILEVIKLHEKGISNKDAFKKVCELLELVGIKAERGSEYPNQFSGGMKQRVVIAMALACNPSLLIADEPTTALDVTIQAQVLQLMKNLKKNFNTSMIMITHDLGVVADICDTIAIMYAGEIIEYGTTERIFHNALHPYTIGLFACIPNMSDEDKQLTPIKGLTPDPTNLPKGCKFHPRCPDAKQICALEIPPNIEIEPGHFVKCHNYREAVNVR